MAWLFERMIETAAWIAFFLGLFFLGGAVWNFVLWMVGIVTSEGELAIRMALQQDLLVTAAQAAIGFIFCGLSVGALACIDRYVFDLPESN